MYALICMVHRMLGNTTEEDVQSSSDEMDDNEAVVLGSAQRSSSPSGDIVVPIVPSPVSMSDEPCCICTEPIETRITLPCKHEFCMTCICTAYVHKRTCPLCRSSMCLPVIDVWEDKVEELETKYNDNAEYTINLINQLERKTAMCETLTSAHTRLEGRVHHYRTELDRSVMRNKIIELELMRLKNPLPDDPLSNTIPRTARYLPESHIPLSRPSASRKGYRVAS